MIACVLYFFAIIASLPKLFCGFMQLDRMNWQATSLIGKAEAFADSELAQDGPWLDWFRTLGHMLAI